MAFLQAVLVVIVGLVVAEEGVQEAPKCCVPSYKSFTLKFSQNVFLDNVPGVGKMSAVNVGVLYFGQLDTEQGDLVLSMNLSSTSNVGEMDMVTYRINDVQYNYFPATNTCQESPAYGSLRQPCGPDSTYLGKRRYGHGKHTLVTDVWQYSEKDKAGHDITVVGDLTEDCVGVSSMFKSTGGAGSGLESMLVMYDAVKGIPDKKVLELPDACKAIQG